MKLSAMTLGFCAAVAGVPILLVPFVMGGNKCTGKSRLLESLGTDYNDCTGCAERISKDPKFGDTYITSECDDKRGRKTWNPNGVTWYADDGNGTSQVTSSQEILFTWWACWSDYRGHKECYFNACVEKPASHDFPTVDTTKYCLNCQVDLAHPTNQMGTNYSFDTCPPQG